MPDLDFLEKLSNSFEKLPGVGKKTASRYAYSVIENMSLEDVESFASALVELKQQIKKCDICGMLTTNNICQICSSTSRDNSKIMILKDTKSIIAVEKMGSYNGLYHSLNGLISPYDGIGPDDVNIDSLEKRLNDNVKELIIATPFTPQGETTAIYLEKIYKKDGLSISRLGYGLPAGGDIEYADELTLKRAIENRRKD
jgi:recombination protein RecR